jgi:hypothetical protein
MLFIKKVMCDEAGTTCHLNECALCPGIENLKQELYMKLEEEMGVCWQIAFQ